MQHYYATRFGTWVGLACSNTTRGSAAIMGNRYTLQMSASWKHTTCSPHGVHMFMGIQVKGRKQMALQHKISAITMLNRQIAPTHTLSTSIAFGALSLSPFSFSTLFALTGDTDTRLGDADFDFDRDFDLDFDLTGDLLGDRDLLRRLGEADLRPWRGDGDLRRRRGDGDLRSRRGDGDLRSRRGERDSDR